MYRRAVTTTDEIRGNQAAADYVGVSVNAWRPYVARGQAPAPDRREIAGGHAIPVWDKTTLDNWKATRPGRGRRRKQPDADDARQR